MTTTALRRLATLQKLPRPAIGRLGARGYATKQAGPTADFYKTFTRPIAKVLLMAVFTYQLAYYGWMKLETDDVKQQAAETIEGLEAKVEEYKKANAQEKN